jgi:hypothetical protein
MRSEISILAGRWDAHTSPPRTTWDRFAATILDRELAAVVGFCAIGLLMTACFIHSLPNFGAIVAALDLTP